MIYFMSLLYHLSHQKEEYVLCLSVILPCCPKSEKTKQKPMLYGKLERSIEKLELFL